jgi:nucleoside diphosphate kinase
MDYRSEILKQVGVIPDAVQRGSVQNVIRWKERAVNAIRVANNPKASERELKTIYTELMRNV